MFSVGDGLNMDGWITSQAREQPDETVDVG